MKPNAYDRSSSRAMSLYLTIVSIASLCMLALGLFVVAPSVEARGVNANALMTWGGPTALPRRNAPFRPDVAVSAMPDDGV
jgi:hypothetical protein